MKSKAGRLLLAAETEIKEGQDEETQDWAVHFSPTSFSAGSAKRASIWAMWLILSTSYKQDSCGDRHTNSQDDTLRPFAGTYMLCID
jgi:hypothetical protein